MKKKKLIEKHTEIPDANNPRWKDLVPIINMQALEVLNKDAEKFYPKIEKKAHSFDDFDEANEYLDIEKNKYGKRVASISDLYGSSGGTGLPGDTGLYAQIEELRKELILKFQARRRKFTEFLNGNDKLAAALTKAFKGSKGKGLALMYLALDEKKLLRVQHGQMEKFFNALKECFKKAGSRQGFVGFNFVDEKHKDDYIIAKEKIEEILKAL